MVQVGKMWIWESDRLGVDKIFLQLRKTFNVSSLPESLLIKISADTRYILEVNGTRICVGPCKSNEFYRYFEHIDIANYLKTGVNVIAAQVIYLPNDRWSAKKFETGAIGMFSTSRGGFALIEDDDEFGISTNSSWKVRRDFNYKFIHSMHTRYAGDMECVYGSADRLNWKKPEFDDSSWNSAIEITDFCAANREGILNNWQVKERTIPLLYEDTKNFVRTLEGPDVVSMFAKGDVFTVEAGSCLSFVLDAGEMQTGYITFDFNDGRGSEVDILYAESYFTERFEDGTPKKTVRDDYVNGFLHGEVDKYIAGMGAQQYEPFFFRAFRFVKVTIITREFPLVIKSISYRETGYPLDIKGSFESNDPLDKAMWDISLRTLKRCTHETYEDCPFYEQIQYSLDTRLQMLFTYYVSGDQRLAQKAIEDFFATQQPNGLVSCNSPAKFVQIIPAFSLYVVMAVKEFYLYSGNLDEMKRYIPSMEKILNYFTDKIDTDTGLVKDIGYWEFGDWVHEWIDQWGACVGKDESYNYLYNMIFAATLEDYAFMCDAAGRHDCAQESMNIKASLLSALRKYSRDKEQGMYHYKLGARKFSQHAQIWAVLSGLSEGAEAEKIMQYCLDDKNLIKCSYSFSYFLCRAVEKVGLYNQYTDMWLDWHNLINLGVSTWPEDPVTQRSECHGWSAIQLYEFPACVLGVKPEKPGYAEIRIQPQIQNRRFAKGDVVTKAGLVHVEWEIIGQKFKLNVKLPQSMKALVVLPNGFIMRHNTDIIYEECILEGEMKYEN